MNRSGKLRILVVEDEASIRDGLADVLAYHGYAPAAVATGDEGLERALAESFALVILDLMLPGLHGLEVCQRLRQERPALPVLILTAKGSEDDVVNGFRHGADDYVTKPFSVRELVVRVEALLRRSGGTPAPRFAFGPWEVDTAELKAYRGRRSVELTPREVALLDFFGRRAGRVVSRRTLLREVWELLHADALETRTVDVHIAKLRKKIDGAGASLIETVRGAGYRFGG